MHSWATPEYMPILVSCRLEVTPPEPHGTGMRKWYISEENQDVLTKGEMAVEQA